MVTFHAKIHQPEARTVTGIIVPPEIVAALGKGKKPPVSVTLNNYTYRSTVFFMHGQFMIPLSEENRIAAGVAGGEEHDIELLLDEAPRTIEVAADLTAALEGAGLRDAFDKLAFTYRKEHVRSVEDAKTAETRTRRIEKVLAALKR